MVVALRNSSPAAPHEKSTVTASNSSLLQATAVTTKRGGLLDQYFYFFMSLLIPAVVVYGFSFTVGSRLIHPAIPPPPILYVHTAVFSGWLLFFLLQSALVRTHKVRWHRRIGWFGGALGVLILGSVFPPPSPWGASIPYKCIPPTRSPS